MSENEMADLAALGEETLAHFGVKGMKWGVRKSGRSTAISTSRASVKSDRAKIKSETNPEVKKQMKRDLKADPKYHTAKMLSTGERVTMALITGGTGLVALHAIALKALTETSEALEGVIEDTNQVNLDYEKSKAGRR